MFLMIPYLLAVCLWVALIVTVRSVWEVRVVLVEVVVVKGGTLIVKSRWRVIGIQ